MTPAAAEPIADIGRRFAPQGRGLFRGLFARHLRVSLGGGTVQQRPCFLCNSRTTYVCKTCEVPLCAIPRCDQHSPDGRSGSCFALYHSHACGACPEKDPLFLEAFRFHYPSPIVAITGKYLDPCFLCTRPTTAMCPTCVVPGTSSVGVPLCVKARTFTLSDGSAVTSPCCVLFHDLESLEGLIAH